MACQVIAPLLTALHPCCLLRRSAGLASPYLASGLRHPTCQWTMVEVPTVSSEPVPPSCHLCLLALEPQSLAGEEQVPSSPWVRGGGVPSGTNVDLPYPFEPPADPLPTGRLVRGMRRMLLRFCGCLLPSDS